MLATQPDRGPRAPCQNGMAGGLGLVLGGPAPRGVASPILSSDGSGMLAEWQLATPPSVCGHVRVGSLTQKAGLGQREAAAGEGLQPSASMA